MRDRIIRPLFFIALFINLTIPKAGIYLRKGEDIRIPLSLGYVVFSFLFLIWMLSNKKGLKKIFLGTCIKKIVLFYLIYTLLRYLFSFHEHKYIGRIMVHYITYGGYLLIFFFALDMARYGRKITEAMVKIIVISMCMVSLYGWLQVFLDSEKISLVGLTEIYGSPEEPLVTYIYGGGFIQEGNASIKNSIVTKDNSGRIVFAGRKVFSTFHHGNLFGGHLVLFTPVILSLLCLTRPGKKKILYFCLGVIMVLSLLFANSRGAIIGFLASGLTLFCLSAEKKKTFSLVILVLLSSVMLFNLILNIAQRYNFKITSAEVWLYRRGVVGRYGTLLEIPRLIKEKLAPSVIPVDTGVERNGADLKLDGMTNYRYRQFKKFYQVIFRRESLKHLIFGRGYSGTTVYQNLYFNLFYNLGIAGVALFVYIIIYILEAAIKSGVIFDPGHSMETRVLAMGGMSGMVGFLTHNLFDNLFFFPPFGLNFWILSGLILVAAGDKEKNYNTVK